ncbi:hypothetical protein, partial [uncultured Fibrobacter sp.]|uniref:hypothetical protein n=1 Tax=uncultured Fibrobacter sp. TaxID=261512 RepID=UPI0025CCC64D
MTLADTSVWVDAKKRCHGAPLSNNVIASPEGARQSRLDLLQLFQCRFIFGNDILLCSQLYSFGV